MSKCEGCGIPYAHTHVKVILTNGALTLCRQCLDEFNGKSPLLIQAKAEIEQLRASNAALQADVEQLLGHAATDAELQYAKDWAYYTAISGTRTNEGTAIVTKLLAHIAFLSQVIGEQSAEGGGAAIREHERRRIAAWIKNNKRLGVIGPAGLQWLTHQIKNGDLI
jgi:hypothetical protein